MQKLAFERSVRAPIALAAVLCLGGSQFIWLPCASADPESKPVQSSTDGAVTATASPVHKPDGHDGDGTSIHGDAQNKAGSPKRHKADATTALHGDAQSKAGSPKGHNADGASALHGDAQSKAGSPKRHNAAETSALHGDAQSKAGSPKGHDADATTALHGDGQSKAGSPKRHDADGTSALHGNAQSKAGSATKHDADGTSALHHEETRHDADGTPALHSDKGWYTPGASLEESVKKTEPKNTGAPGMSTGTSAVQNSNVETLKTEDSAKAATTAGSKANQAKPPELKSETPLLTPLPLNQPDTAKPPPPTTTTNTAATKNPPGEDHYPAVAKMESLTFGASQPTLDLQERLTKLEQAVFQQTFADATLFDRTEKLKKTLLGGDDEFPASDLNRSASSMSLTPFSESNAAEVDYFDSMAARPENQERVTKEALVAFALAAINYERAKAGSSPLELDDTACKVAKEHVEELCRRNVITHNNMKGDNPDRRFTVAGGDGALVESIISNKTLDTLSQSPTKAAVINVLKQITNRQDDKDAVFNPEATKIGFAIDWTPGKDKVIAVTEVITNHGIIHPLPIDTRVGEKLEIKGVVLEPYKFEKVTLAWEANHEGEQPPSDDPDEAMPYFPPLDYVAYAAKSEHDYSTAMGTLRTVGIIAAIAGGMFIPPVALAASVIAMSGNLGSGEPKPASDIPVHGGMKMEGSTFSGKITLNKEGKEGIYYVTVWASNGKYTKPIPISRQAIIARGATEDVAAKIESGEHEKKAKKAKKSKKDDQASAQP